MKRRSVLAIALALFVAACSDSSGPDDAEVEGTFTLRTINGAVLPFTLEETSAGKVEVMSDFYTLNDDGTYDSTIDFRLTEAGEVTLDSANESGTYSVRGSRVTFTPSVDPSGYTATYADGKLTFTSENVTAVYVR